MRWKYDLVTWSHVQFIYHYYTSLKDLMTSLTKGRVNNKKENYWNDLFPFSIIILIQPRQTDTQFKSTQHEVEHRSRDDTTRMYGETCMQFALHRLLIRTFRIHWGRSVGIFFLSVLCYLTSKWYKVSCCEHAYQQYIPGGRGEVDEVEIRE